ncbi:hypothetical protein D3C78_755940 [compost metagenome]
MLHDRVTQAVVVLCCLVACRRNGFAPIVQAALQLVALLQQRLQMFEYLQLCAAAAGKCQQNLIRRAAGACGEPCGFDSFEQLLAGDAMGGRAAATEWVAQAAIGQAHGRTVAWAYGLHAQQHPQGRARQQRAFLYKALQRLLIGDVHACHGRWQCLVQCSVKA